MKIHSLKILSLCVLVLGVGSNAQSTKAAAAEKIRIAYPSGMNGQVVVAMQKAGILEKLGLSPQYTAFQYGPPMMEALASGAIDAVVTSLLPVTSYAAKVPGDVKIVAMVGQSSHSLMVSKESGIPDKDGLIGKTLGVSFGSDSHLDTLTWLKNEKLFGNVTLVNIAPSELASSLASKSIDGIVVRQPQVLRLQEQGGAVVLHTWPFHFVSIVKSKFLQEHPAEVTKYISGLREAMLYVAQNHEQAAKWFGESLRMDPAVIQKVSVDDPMYKAKSLDQIDLSVTPSSRALITQWAADSYAQGLIKSKVDLDDLFAK
jgi:ABC-type nitrate/sulfonate/bicarbonate transport system substrate-binding protein